MIRLSIDRPTDPTAKWKRDHQWLRLRVVLCCGFAKLDWEGISGGFCCVVGISCLLPALALTHFPCGSLSSRALPSLPLKRYHSTISLGSSDVEFQPLTYIHMHIRTYRQKEKKGKERKGTIFEASVAGRIFGQNRSEPSSSTGVRHVWILRAFSLWK